MIYFVKNKITLACFFFQTPARDLPEKTAGGEHFRRIRTVIAIIS